MSGQGWVWITQAWRLFAKHWFIWLVQLLVAFIVLGIIAEFKFIGQVVVALLFPAVVAGVMIGCRAIERGEKLKVKHLFAGFKINTSELMLVGAFNMVTYFIITFVTKAIIVMAGGAAFLAVLASRDILAIMAAVSAFLVGVLLALIVALVLLTPVLMALWFATPLVVFRNANAYDALKLSFEACTKNLMPFLFYGLITLLLLIVASPTVVGLFVLFPVLMGTLYTSYSDVFPET